MNDLTAAREQLEKAITRLEAALAERGGDAATIERALKEARAESVRLKATAENVSGRLEAVIGRLRSALGEDAPR
jgi:F0F1-type ATP synthase assembly protein I